MILGHIKPFNYSRGQVSWFEVHPQIYDHLPSPTLKYGGYCAKFEQDDRYYVMIGASFVRDTLDITVNRHEHEVNVADFCQKPCPRLPPSLPISRQTHSGMDGHEHFAVRRWIICHWWGKCGKTALTPIAACGRFRHWVQRVMRMPRLVVNCWQDWSAVRFCH